MTEEKLQSIDFSKFSKIESSLLTTLLNKRKRHALTLEELNNVAAAGNGVSTINSSFTLSKK